MSSSATQDLPPRGGFGKIIFNRVPSKTFFRGWHLLLGFTGAHLIGFYVISQRRHKQNYLDIEMWSAFNTIKPVIDAEYDRKVMKQLRFNREEEERLMANVPNWEVGTYFGQPVYKKFDPNAWYPLKLQDLYTHADRKVMEKRASFHLYN